jgi:predicted  nucleic acid-binding Zn-ribbon protein
VARLEQQIREGSEEVSAIARKLADSEAQVEQANRLLHDEHRTERLHRLEAELGTAVAKVDSMESELAKVRAVICHCFFRRTALARAGSMRVCRHK